MNTTFFKTSLFLAVLCLAVISNAQERIVHGVVTTFDSIPLIDAEVQVRSTKQTVLTDTLGMFSVAVNPEDRLKSFSNRFFQSKSKTGRKNQICCH
jgi:hypothetical protein